MTPDSKKRIEKFGSNVNKTIKAANALSLGISMVVAVALGLLLGLALEKIFHKKWLIFLGLFWGVAAAILNVYKAYKSHKRDLEELACEKKGHFDENH